MFTLTKLNCMNALRRSCVCFQRAAKFKNNRIGRFVMMSSLTNLRFDNKALKCLPIDESKSIQSRTVPGSCFSLISPTSVDNPHLVAHSTEALELLGIEEEDIKQDDFVKYFSGNKLFDGSKPAAHCYCGHQFGYFSGQLGDGAAMYLGEIINNKGERWELQLKGAGKTPYSRNSDGRKVLRSSIREFLCSEAMHHLGIPTTRAAACVTSDSRVVRDIFYDGNPIMERCTIVSRIAPTFLRFGSFEIFKPEDSQTGRSGPSVGRKDILEKMLEYVVTTFFSDISTQYPEDRLACYMEFYKEVVRRTAKVVAMWQCFGFCHGVLNTDNMSILGLTIDYGPYGFMDYFDSDYICNASDNRGRYTYKKQPEICKWNLMKFAEGLQLVLPINEMKKHLNDIYDSEFSKHYYDMMRNKIGITKKDGVNDEDLIQKLIWTMHETACDFNNLFLHLSKIDIITCENDTIVDNILGLCQNIESFKKRLDKDSNPQLEMIINLAQTNPSLVSQLGVDLEQLKEMIEASVKKKEVMEWDEEKKKGNDLKLWSEWIEEYRNRLKLEIDDIEDDEEIKHKCRERKNTMESSNPKLILRNHLAHEAIQLAEDGDFTKVRELLKRLKSPFLVMDEEKLEKDGTDVESRCAYPSAPTWAADLQVT